MLSKYVIFQDWSVRKHGCTAIQALHGLDDGKTASHSVKAADGGRRIEEILRLHNFLE